jgi:hypothetical protein
MRACVHSKLAKIAHACTAFDLAVHTWRTRNGDGVHTQMPSSTKLKSGTWRVQVRRKSHYVANTFIRRRDAEEWAIEAERSIDRGTPIRRSKSHEQPRIFSDLIALHLDDLAQEASPYDGRSPWYVRKPHTTNTSRLFVSDNLPFQSRSPLARYSTRAPDVLITAFHCSSSARVRVASCSPL